MINRTLKVNGNIQVTGLVYNPNPNYTGQMTWNATTYFGNGFCYNMNNYLQNNANNDDVNIDKIVIYDNSGNFRSAMIGFTQVYPQLGIVMCSAGRATTVTLNCGITEV